ncbi:hypothetical protein J3Q09_19695 [Pseudomonas sp. R4-83]|uniref:RCC1 domain-containing protein n=1 Tax=unclassified Pseudomonas TaxID=196821 RepID=UPI003DA94BDE
MPNEKDDLPLNRNAEGELLVMGARGNRGGLGNFYTRSWRLVALDASTLNPLNVTWQYVADKQSVTGSAFFDVRPYEELIVSSGQKRITLNPSNIIGTSFALCARLDSGKVHAWGYADAGGTLPEPIKEVHDVVELSAAMGAFAIRRAQGNVLAWGHYPNGTVPEDIAQLDTIVAVSGSTYVFVALLESGRIVAWGRPDTGGELPAEIADLTDITQASGGQYGFAALRRSGNVVCWGYEDQSPQLPDDIALLTDITRLACSTHAFAVLSNNGQVRAWGSDYAGGKVPSDIEGLRDIVDVASCGSAFAARRSNGTLVAWGHVPPMPDEIASRNDIAHVIGSATGFVVLCRDGAVLAWADTSSEINDIPSDIRELRDIVAINANQHAAVALRSNGVAVAWGREADGGDTSAVADLLTNVRAVYGGGDTFVALRADRRVVAWGNAAYGGNGEQKALHQSISYTKAPAS